MKHTRSTQKQHEKHMQTTQEAHAQDTRGTRLLHTNALYLTAGQYCVYMYIQHLSATKVQGLQSTILIEVGGLRFPVLECLRTSLHLTG